MSSSTGIPASDTGGVKPMAIAGRMVRERERCIGMTPEERAWRAQWLKDQVLTQREPVFVPEYWQAIRNPIRRFYQAPLNAFYKVIVPVLGHNQAVNVRVLTGHVLQGIALLYLTAYYFKYHQNDWTTRSGWNVMTNRKRLLPGDPGWPAQSDRTQPHHYNDRGFSKSPI